MLAGMLRRSNYWARPADRSVTPGTWESDSEPREKIRSLASRPVRPLLCRDCSWNQRWPRNGSTESRSQPAESRSAAMQRAELPGSQEIGLPETYAVSGLGGSQGGTCFVKATAVYSGKKANDPGDSEIATQRDEPGIHTMIRIAPG